MKQVKLKKKYCAVCGEEMTLKKTVSFYWDDTGKPFYEYTGYHGGWLGFLFGLHEQKFSVSDVEI